MGTEGHPSRGATFKAYIFVAVRKVTYDVETAHRQGAV